MQKICQRCGCNYEAGEAKRRRYCEACRTASMREHEQICRRLLEGDPRYRRARRALNAAITRRRRAFESRLLSREEIDALNADCDAALAELRQARKRAWARLGKPLYVRVNAIFVTAVTGEK